MKYVRGRFKPNDTRPITHFPHQIHLVDPEDEKIWERVKTWPDLKPEVREWCNENYGPAFRKWAYYTGAKFIRIYFATKEEAMAFKIMWS
jgi:hypothetical protein